MGRLNIIIVVFLLTTSVCVKGQERLIGFHKKILEFTKKYASELSPLVKFHDWDVYSWELDHVILCQTDEGLASRFK